MQLLAHDAQDRLHGSRAKEHAFFEPINGLWEDVAALELPPFAHVVWPEVRPDTQLDLRAYSDADADDSFEVDDHLATWLAMSDEIPFASGPIHSQVVDVEAASVSSIQEARSEDDVGVEEDHLCENDGDLPADNLDDSCGVCLEVLPTIPSLDSHSVKSRLSLVTLATPRPSTSRLAVPFLRRRAVVHDLRKVFYLANAVTGTSAGSRHADVSQQHSTTAGAALAPRAVRAADVGRQAMFKHPSERASGFCSGMTRSSTSGEMSFEHQITLALLDSMDSKLGEAGSHVATLSCTGLGACYGKRAVGGGLGTSTSCVEEESGGDTYTRTRGQKRAVVRKLRSLASYVGLG